MVGRTISHYQILEKLGEGGMGVVYKARDTKLGRHVAVKVLHEQFAHDPHRMARFSREAHLLASLNHPHIASIYGIEEQDGVHALVMELVGGPTLADRIAQGAIPLEAALGLAQQMAEALEYAHEHGIVHRDLKPANVKVTEEGAVKLLDFGVAKAMEDEAAAGDPANSPTLTLGATKAGVILGTAAYMSPEQARGKPVDKRADIWAFGAVLYEMLTGRRLFEGETTSDTLAAVLKEEPNLSAVPPKVRRLLRRCLEKDPRKRLRDIGDAWELLEETPPAPTLRPRNWLPWAVAAVLGVALGVVGLLWLRAPAPEIRSTQFLVEAPGDTQFTGGYTSAAASPDGRYLVFSAGSAALTAPLWLRPVDSLSARPLQGTEGGFFVFWSPDSKSLAFYAGGKLKRSDIAGGAPQVLCDAEYFAGAGGTWNRNGEILFATAEGLYRVPASGGVAQQVTQLDAARKESEHGVPQFLPDGKRFLYFIGSADPNVRGIYAGWLDKPNERLRLLDTNHKAYYVPPGVGRTGFLLWLRDQTLLARPFDAARLRLEGDATPLAEDVAYSQMYSVLAAFWASDAGLLAYRTGADTPKAKLIWMNRDGNSLGEVGKDDRYGGLRISPDGKRVAVARTDDGGNTDIWMFEFGREVMTRLTIDPNQDGMPVWSPDGRQIAYSSARRGVRQICRTDAGGGGQEEQLTNSPNSKALWDWSPDGRHLLYSEAGPKTGYDLWALALEGEQKPIAVLQTPSEEYGAQFSPDGKWVAYVSNESGRFEVYVRAFPVSSSRWQVSNQGGIRPKWRADGKELFFLGPDLDKILAAVIRVTGVSFQSDKPRELFTVSPLSTNLGSPYDVTADGQRFLVWQPSTAATGPAPLTVVTNWQARLKR